MKKQKEWKMVMFTEEYIPKCGRCGDTGKRIEYENLTKLHGLDYDTRWDLGPPPRMVIIICECMKEKDLTIGLDGDSI